VGPAEGNQQQNAYSGSDGGSHEKRVAGAVLHTTVIGREAPGLETPEGSPGRDTPSVFGAGTARDSAVRTACAWSGRIVCLGLVETGPESRRVEREDQADRVTVGTPIESDHPEELHEPNGDVEPSLG